MAAASNEKLIDSAQGVLNPQVVGDRLFGDVGSTLVTDKGNRYSGVCIDTGSGMGFCAEHSTEVVLGRRRSAKLRDLLPLTEWPTPLD
jgi:cytidine deaminase